MHVFNGLIWLFCSFSDLGKSTYFHRPQPRDPWDGAGGPVLGRVRGTSQIELLWEGSAQIILLMDLKRIHKRGESKSGVFYNPVMYWTIFTCTRSNWTSSIVPKLTKMTPPWSININHVLFNEKITSRRMKLEMLVTFCSCNEQPFYYIKVKNDVIVLAISKLSLVNRIGRTSRWKQISLQQTLLCHFHCQP